MPPRPRGARSLVAGDDRQPRRARALGGHQQPGRHLGDGVRQGTGRRGHRFVRLRQGGELVRGRRFLRRPARGTVHSRGGTTGKGSPPPRHRSSRASGHRTCASPGPGEPGMDCTSLPLADQERPTARGLDPVVQRGVPGAHRRSSSRIVPRPRPSRISAADAPDRLTKNVSSASLFLSPLTTMVIVLLVSPGAKVSVPDWAS